MGTAMSNFPSLEMLTSLCFKLTNTYVCLNSYHNQSIIVKGLLWLLSLKVKIASCIGFEAESFQPQSLEGGLRHIDWLKRDNESFIAKR